jgi:hypothetical protein
MPAGKIYDTDETTRIKDFLNIQTKELKALESEKSVTDKTVIRYAIVISGAVIVLLAVKFLTRKK